MFYPPSFDLRHEPPASLPVYDNPPVISSSPRWAWLRRIAADRSPRRRTRDLPATGLGATPLRPRPDEARREAS